MNNQLARNLLAITIAVLLGLAAYSVLTMPDQRNTTEKVGDAIHDLPQGLDKAGRQLEDRTPGQKLGDALKDTGDKIKDFDRAAAVPVMQTSPLGEPMFIEQRHAPAVIEEPVIVDDLDDGIPDSTGDGQAGMVRAMPENNIAQKIAKSWITGKGNLILFLVIVIFVAVIVGQLLSI